jgi:hypothetical protein
MFDEIASEVPTLDGGMLDPSWICNCVAVFITVIGYNIRCQWLFAFFWYKRSSYFDYIYGFLKTRLNDLQMDYGDDLNSVKTCTVETVKLCSYEWLLLLLATINSCKPIFNTCE